MTINQRQFRSPDSRVKQVLDRLNRETGGHSFAQICDMISIPRDLRASLLDQLVREGYVTDEGGQVRLTEAGKALAIAPFTPPPDDGIRNPSPRDNESRVRTPGSGRRHSW